MSMTTHDDNSSDGNELLERAIEELRATDPRDDMPREVSDRILTIVDAQGSAPAQTSTADASRRFVMSRIGAIGVLVAGVVIAVGIWRNVQPDGPSAGERRAASENATPHPGAALNQRDTGSTTNIQRLAPSAIRPRRDCLPAMRCDTRTSRSHCWPPIFWNGKKNRT